jgi:hypothetical protein
VTVTRAAVALLQVDNFIIKGTDVGDISKVVISHDDSGIGSAWLCQQVGWLWPPCKHTGRALWCWCNVWVPLLPRKSAGCEHGATMSSRSFIELPRCESHEKTPACTHALNTTVTAG